MDLNDFLEEAAIMKEMKHANLVQLLGKLITECCCYQLSIRNTNTVLVTSWSL